MWDRDVGGLGATTRKFPPAASTYKLLTLVNKPVENRISPERPVKAGAAAGAVDPAQGLFGASGWDAGPELST